MEETILHQLSILIISLIWCYFFFVAARRTLKSGISPEDMEKLTKQYLDNIDSK